MNRLELLALLLSLDRLCDKDDFEGVSVVVKELLKEIRKDDKPEKNEK